MTTTEPGRARASLGALAGLVSAVVALGVAELSAALGRAEASPVVAVGGAVVDAAPVWLKEYAIRTFGTQDKPVLLGSILAALVMLALLAGILAVRRIALGLAGIAALGLVGAVAAATRPVAHPSDVVPSLLGAATGAVVLVLLVLRLRRLPEPDAPNAPDVPDARRRFLLAAAGAAGVGVVTGSVGRLANGRRTSVTAARSAVVLPQPSSPAPPLPRGTDLRLPGLTSFRTPNKEFYRVDTALLVPRVDVERWRLRVHGLVEREIELDFAQLLARPMVERDITLTCVSNEVGGRYAGTARWLGAPLADLLAEAGVRPESDMLLSRSVDGMTIGTPTAVVMDGRDALLAVGMNGEPLPVEHGFPVRMVVPGLYGYVSATKWVVDLELTSFDADEAYWTQRGWAARGPIRTMSRIDTPRPLAKVPAGRVAVAGVAWAQHRGIARVEVRVDEGPWQQAELAAVPSVDTWRQWVWRWDATPGSHTLEVRATDLDGTVQPQRRTDPFPSGATGWHSTVVTVA